MQGGGSGQFTAIPLNLCRKLGEEVDYIITGRFSEDAAKEADKYCKVNKITLEENNNYTKIPDFKSKLNQNAKYVYYCSNETINGIEFHDIIDTDKLLVCDMSSNFLSRKIDVSKFGLIYAAAQKNAGIVGIVIVIIRDDLLNQANPMVPYCFHYELILSLSSIHITPATFPIYISNLCLKYFKKIGGLDQIEQNSIEKSRLIYDLIDESSGFYVSNVDKTCRSRVNIPFRIGNGEELEKKFVDECAKNGILQISGLPRPFGIDGLRISLYNAISLNETQYLANFMLKFQKDNQLL